MTAIERLTSRSGRQSTSVSGARSILLAALVLAYAAPPAFALDPARYISQYGHTAWRLQDGIFGGAPTTLTQTSDGYLWIGTETGLVRFDGVRFSPLVSTENEPSLNHIVSLLSTTDGSLWIGTTNGLFRLKNGHLTSIQSTGVYERIREDREGNIWVTRSHTGGNVGPLCEVLAGTLHCYGKSDGIPLRDARAVLIDALGNIWVASETQLTRWNRSTRSSTFTLPGMQGSESLDGISELTIRNDTSMLVGVQFGHGLGLQTFSQGNWQPYKLPGFDGSAIAVSSMLLDRNNSLWIGTVDQGIYRVIDNTVTHFGSVDGLSSDTVVGLFEDHEGDLWVTTSNGMDRFRDMRIASFSKHEGLSADAVNSVVAAKDGTIWLGNGPALDSLRGGRVLSTAASRLPGKELTSLLEDHKGRLWVGVDDKLSISVNGKFIPVKKRDGSQTGTVVAMTEDSSDNVWAQVIGPPALLRIGGTEVEEEIPDGNIPQTFSLAADRRGGVWLGLRDRRLARFQDGKLEVFGMSPPTQGGIVVDVIITADDAVIGASSRGLVAWRHGTLRTMTVNNGLPCDRINSLVSDKQRNLWLYMQCGLVEILSSDLEEWWKRPNAIVTPTRFDAFDGVHPGHPSFQPTATLSPDGRVWFANEYVVQVIDPAHLPTNALPPPVHIEQVIADHKTYSSRTTLTLPALTRDLEIDYTALSLVIPEKVRFRYRLNGHDGAWVDSGTRRQAFYNDLSPGHYIFQVIAANNDGVWNETGASIGFSIAAAWYQTRAFLLFCVMLGTAFVWSVYRIRVRQIAKAIGARFDERMAERTRLAQELHDTLLQTIQGSKMVADDSLDDAMDLEHMRATMRRVSQWLGQATQEGRAALSSLRVSVTLRNDLAEAFQRAADDCLLHRAMEVRFDVVGEPREMHPIARDEVYRVGYEAIRNACSHSAGSRLIIQLTYSEDLLLRVSDNGVGMDGVIVELGREGHFGLRGMRERALRIGGKLSITSTPTSGTDITLWVPGKIIFRRTAPNPKSLIQKVRHWASRSAIRLSDRS